MSLLVNLLVTHALMSYRYVEGNDYEVTCWCGWSERRTGSDSEALWRRRAWAEHVLNAGPADARAGNVE
jgi:hypothetical protein